MRHRYRKQYHYHVSAKRLDYLDVKRALPMCPSQNEPDVPRLCVCPSVPGCFAARVFTKRKDLYVYRTLKKTKGIKPYRVWDAVITGERWLIPPMRLERIATIDREDVARIQCYSVPILWTGADIQIRTAQLAIAWDVLGKRFPNHQERRVCRFLLERFKVGDPEIFFLKKFFEEAS